MLKKYRGSNDFNKIYLPDVFSASSMSRTLTLLLLSDLMKNTYLPSKQISLYAFVEALVKQSQNIEFLKRGDIFESKYQVLWPDCSVIEKETAENYAYIQSLEKRENAVSNRENEFTEALLRLETFADKLRQIICGTLKTNAYALECEFRDLREDPSVIQMLQTFEAANLNLRQFKNKISLVFHSTTDGEMNVLFTGDIPGKYMEMIAANYDDALPLHEHYWCVKVPNHGIQADYFDFTDYTPENMLISNGIYYADNKKQTKAYRTSAQYAGLFYINDTHMYCSSSACCDGYRNGCTCKECDVISPQYYKDI